MDIVIDANVLSWFYKESELQKSTPCTSSPTKLFEALGRKDTGILDTGGQIEAEWRRKVDEDWLEAWLIECFQLGELIEIKATTQNDLIRDLETRCGFGKKGGDKWYVRTAKTRSEETDSRVGLISEDLDFFEPKSKKGAGNRDRILAGCTGCVAKRLKKVNIDVKTVKKHVEP